MTLVLEKEMSMDYGGMGTIGNLHTQHLFISSEEDEHVDNATVLSFELSLSSSCFIIIIIIMGASLVSTDGDARRRHG